MFNGVDRCEIVGISTKFKTSVRTAKGGFVLKYFDTLHDAQFSGKHGTKFAGYIRKEVEILVREVTKKKKKWTQKLSKADWIGKMRKQTLLEFTEEDFEGLCADLTSSLPVEPSIALPEPVVPLLPEPVAPPLPEPVAPPLPEPEAPALPALVQPAMSPPRVRRASLGELLLESPMA